MALKSQVLDNLLPLLEPRLTALHENIAVLELSNIAHLDEAVGDGLQRC